MTDGSLILIFFQRFETGDSLILKYVLKTGTGGSSHINSKNYTTLECSPSSMEPGSYFGEGGGSVSPDLSAQWHQPNNVSRPSPMSPPGQ
jgi:hypothetical protein